MRNNVRTRSASNYTFSQVPRADIPRSSFQRSHTHKTTFDAGYLIPIYVDEVLPGDTFSLKMDVFGRLATPIFPIMDGLYLESFFFFVPNRLVWNNWQRFMGEQDNPDDSVDYLVPTLQKASATDKWDPLTIGDYMGLPTAVPQLEVNALPFRAYNLIWNEWFRDQNLQDSVTVPKTDGPDAYDVYRLKKRGKRHDYFTGCLPWPQKGPGVEIAIGDTAPIKGIGKVSSTFGATNQAVHEAGGKDVVYADSIVIDPVNGMFRVVNDPLNPGYPGIYADLSQALSTTINSLRTSFQIQKLMERDARGGTRYTEILRSHFGVQSPDGRLQRPEYLGGGHTPLMVNPVTQTSATDATTTPQGNMSAYGILTGGFHGFSKSFVEHGYIIGLICARADLSYQQGLHKMWSRQTKYDFYWPALAHLGEQAVLNKELYAVGSNNMQDEGVFGYQERWAEYRYGVSKITGRFRSTDPVPLDSWHLAQEFTALPTLGPTFIEEDPPIDRVIAVTNEPHFIFDSFFSINCVRPMPVYSVPGLIDHF